jgi:multiple sugar transport system substrate-binding protein
MRTRGVVTAAVLVAAVVASLTACTSTGTPTAEGFSTEAPAKDTTATINVWGYVSEDTPWIQESIDAFNKNYPDATVVYTYYPFDQIAAKLLGTAVAGGGPDGLIYNPSDAAKLAESGVIGDMAPFWNEFADADKFPDSVVWKNADAVVSVQGYVNTTALFYNKDILDQLGIDPPTTVEELGDDLKLATDAGFGGMTMCANPTAESEFQIFPWLVSDGQNYGSYDAAGVSKVFGRFADWIDAGYIPRDIVGWTQGDAMDKFSGGNYAFVQGGNWTLSGDKAFTFNWGVAPLPAGSAGSFSVGGGEGISIGANSKEAALTWEYFKSSLLDKDFELSLLQEQGNIPVRADAANAPAISSDPNLKVFAQVVADMKNRPSTAKMSDYLLAMGKVWNAVASGLTSPDDAAQQVVDTMNDVS